MEVKTQKTMNAMGDALQHMHSAGSLTTLDYTHIDQMLARIVDLPMDTKQKNSRRNLRLIRQWMLEEGSAIVLLEVLGQVYWRLGDLNEKQFTILREKLAEQPAYVSLVRDEQAAAAVVERINLLQEKKNRACEDFVQRLKTTDHRIAIYRNSSDSESIGDDPDTVDVVQYGTLLDSIDIPVSRPGDYLSKMLQRRRLWRNEREHLLIDFYVRVVSPCRTLLRPSNVYLSLLKVAERCESIRFAVLSLSASYVKRYLTSAIDVQSYHEADHFYMGECLRALMHEVTNMESSATCFMTGLLLVHHSIIDEAELPECWTCHLRIFDIFPVRSAFANSDAAVYVARQLILAQTIQGAAQIAASQGSEWKDRLVECTDDRLNVIVGITGFSRRLLHVIGTITYLSVSDNGPQESKDALAEDLQSYLQRPSDQWTSEVTGDKLQVVLDTASSYQLAAQIYFQCRYHGLTSTHPVVAQLHQELSVRLLSLPTSGSLYTAIYPIWAVFIALVTGSPASHQSLFNRFQRSIEEMKLTGFMLDTFLQTISTLQQFLDSKRSKSQRRKGWWEEMLAVLGTRGTALCL